MLAAPNEEGPFDHVGTFKIEGNGGQRAARKLAFQQKAELRKAVEGGGKLFLAAVPASSWDPTEVTLEQPPPRLHI